MIPSRNEGIEDLARNAMARWTGLNAEWDFDPEAFAKKHGLADAKEKPKSLIWPPYIPLVCDCCGTVISDFYDTRSFLQNEHNQQHYANRIRGFIRVLDKIYFGCRSECATALFTIHHQYAMREKQGATQ